MPEEGHNSVQGALSRRAKWLFGGMAVLIFLLLVSVLAVIFNNFQDRSALSAVVPDPLVGTPVEKPLVIHPFPDTTDGIHVFNDQLAVWDMSEAQFEFAATHYDGTQKVFASDVRRFRSGNPNFVILNYRLGEGLGYRSTSGECLPDGDWVKVIEAEKWLREYPTNPPEEWFYHIDGQRVLFCDWGWYLMDTNNPAWRTYWAAEVFRQLRANGADGIFVDSLIPPNYYGGDRFSPQLPVIDEAFEQEWAARIEAFIAFGQSGDLADYYFIPNVGEWATGRDTTDYSGADGVMVEGFGRWTDGAYFSAAQNDWQLQMDRVLQMVNQDKVLLLQQYVDGADTKDRLFLLGSYLLVKGRYTYINLEFSPQPEWFPEYSIPIGEPVGGIPSSVSSLWHSGWGVYVRTYSNGLVLVNPSDEVLTVDLGQMYYQAFPAGGGVVPFDGDVSGWIVDYMPVTSLNLGANRAVILLDQLPE